MNGNFASQITSPIVLQNIDYNAINKALV